MSTRKIKDAKDLSTNELIYFKSHAQATFMSDGRTVEEAINSIDAGGGSDVPDMSGYVTEEELASALLGMQPTLVSGENIKTINGKSLLGSGNIEISGGSKEFVEVAPTQEPLGYYGDLGTIVPNNVYVFTKPIYALNVSQLTRSDSKGDEYSIMFTASKDNIPMSLPSGLYNIYWTNGVVPTINSGDLCELSLVRIGYDIKAILTTFKAV